MAFKPRADEVAAVVSLLNAEGDDGESVWDSPEALATAVIKKSFEILQGRDQLWVVAVPNGYGQSVIYGPYAYSADAQRAATKCEWEGATIRPLYGEQLLLPFGDLEPSPRVLCQCGHPKATHEHEKGRGWCWAMGGSIKPNAGSNCGCTSFEEAA